MQYPSLIFIICAENMAFFLLLSKNCITFAKNLQNLYLIYVIWKLLLFGKNYVTV